MINVDFSIAFGMDYDSCYSRPEDADKCCTEVSQVFKSGYLHAYCCPSPCTVTLPCTPTPP